MCVSSFIFVGSIERKHLVKDAENILIITETEINSVFLEYEPFLSGYTETIRNMILWGVEENTIINYKAAIMNLMINDTERMRDTINVHGYFFIWGGTYISGKDQNPDNEYIPQEHSWITSAVEAEGKIVITENEEERTYGEKRNNAVKISRCITDENGNPIAVICIEIDCNRLFRNVIVTNLTRSSYGVLFNEKLEVIAHQEPYLIGEKLGNINSGLAELVPELQMGLNVYERRIKNYANESSIVYFQKIKYGWYYAIVIPVSEYYRNVTNMAVFLTIIGLFLAAALCFMLYRISLAKMKSDMRTQQKSNFLATMSHEIRTPLNAILGMTEIQMQDPSHPPSTSESFIKINNSGNLLLNIINDILDLSKIETGKLELMPAKYQTAILFNDIVQLNHIRYENKPIEFIISIDETIPSVLIGDELRIKQILNNLLSNAFKYTDKGKVWLTANAECISKGGIVNVTLVCEVKDTGQGLTSQQINKLFNESSRFNMEANRTSEGAGLGMTITQNLVELMYGKISVKSQVGEGTTVTVRLPQKTEGMGIRGIIGKEMAENLRQYRHGNIIQLKKSQFTHEYMPYGSILIVDDVETNLYVAKGLIAPYGVKIDLATNGFDAVKKVKEGTVYDIIFMDHMMPKMDGIETTKLLREMGYKRPVVALTANALAGQEEVFMKNGFDGFISKPIDIRQLNVTMNRLIRDKYPSDVIEAAKKEKAALMKKNEDPSAPGQIDSQLAEIFCRDAEKASAVLATTFEKHFRTESDLQSYVINVHAMKSALANIGEKELSSVALRLEQAGREKNINVLLSETGNFIEELRKIILKIKPKDKEENIEDTQDTLAYLCEKLKIIRGACEAFDKKTAKNVLTELREKTWSQKTKELINLMSEQLLHSDFDKTIALADEYLKEK
jgi:signal transduction histidine kinase/DNA-binding response OmpR family regulator/HPt (histidine-containing phosphotransfer) domain-containing protein